MIQIIAEQTSSTSIARLRLHEVSIRLQSAPRLGSHRVKRQVGWRGVAPVHCERAFDGLLPEHLVCREILERQDAARLTHVRHEVCRERLVGQGVVRVYVERRVADALQCARQQNVRERIALSQHLLRRVVQVDRPARAQMPRAFLTTDADFQLNMLLLS